MSFVMFNDPFWPYILAGIGRFVRKKSDIWQRYGLLYLHTNKRINNEELTVRELICEDFKKNIVSVEIPVKKFRYDEILFGLEIKSEPIKIKFWFCQTS